MNRVYGSILLTLKLALVMVLLSACGAEGVNESDSDKQAPVRQQPVASGLQSVTESPSLTEFPGSISQAGDPSDVYERPPLAEARPLDDEAVGRLLGRLDPLPTDVDDVQEFALRPGSLPPPRTGETVRAEFPPPEERELPTVAVPDGPLQILRFGPEGEVPVAGQVSLTFDRPMVAVTAHDDTLADGIPATLTPEIAGNWRWVGVRTLLFEPQAPRLPMATEFRVSIGSEVTAADGAGLDEAHEWTFSTPPLRLLDSYPSGGSNPLDPVIVLVFDQRIDLDRLGDSLQVLDGQGKAYAWRAASDEEIAADSRAQAMVKLLEPGRWIALVLDQPLPVSSRISLVLAAGSASAEGPLTTTSEQRREFSTYGAFMVNRANCGWQQECTPLDPLSLGLTNDLEPDQDLSALISVEPEVISLTIEGRGRGISISGLKRGQTTYTVRLDEALADRFGQTISGGREFQFEVGSLRPSLSLGTEELTTLDPGSSPALEFFSTNYASAQVRIQRVAVGDWPTYQATRRSYRGSQDDIPPLPGQTVFDGEIDIDPRRDELVRTRLDLARWLEGERSGHLIVALRPGRLLEGVYQDRRPHTQMTWAQATAIGIDVAIDNEQLLVWTTALADGQALANTRIEMGGMTGTRTTDSEGLVRIELPERSELKNQANWIVASQSGDSALLPESRHWATRSNWHRRDSEDEVLWYVFDDRAMYRPGETVHIKGWLRRMEKRPDGGLGLISQPAEIRYSLSDSRGNEILNGQTDLAGLGGFDLSFELPDTPNLGRASLRLNVVGVADLGNTSHVHPFDIQEFRTPEFEVRTDVPAGPFIGSKPVDVTVHAAYYAGGVLPGADVRWSVAARPGQYTPPNRSDWSFGFQMPWWMPWGGPDQNGSASRQFEGLTDGSGRHGITVELDFDAQPRPLLIEAQATVMDVNRQAWQASSELLFHPGEVYVGLKTDTYFVERSEPLLVDLISVDLDGQPVAGRSIMVEAGRVQFTWRDGHGEQGIQDVQRCEVVSDAEGLSQCRFETPVGGQYRITATIMDESGRRNASRIMRWVGGSRMAGSERVEIESVLLIPDADSHAPGEIARLLVNAPFDQAEGLLTLRRHGLAEQRRFTVTDGSATLEIPVRADWMPNIQAHVLLVGQADRGDDADSALPSRPAIAVGQHELSISTAERVLDVAISPAASALAPGESTSVDLQVTDADGQPVAGAEIALVVVDEAILALSNYRITDPLEVFYRHRPPDVSDLHLRPSIRLLSEAGMLDTLADQVVGSGEVMADGVAMERSMMPALAMPPSPGEAAADPIAVRQDFNPLAAFVPGLITDNQGRITTTVQLPDNLTRYRITAVAVESATRYGTAEASLTARLPLMLRPSPPRFLNFGDQFEFPLVLQNQTDETLTVEVALDTANLALTDSRGYVLEVPPNDRVEVRFPAAADQAGTARYQVAAATTGFADAARGQLPVWTPATSEAFATYGEVDEGAIRQPVIMPSAVWPQFGQLEITTSSTAVQSLTDAFLYLHHYPFACAEQVASRIIATAALRDILQAFAVEGMPSEAEIATSMSLDLQRLAGLQNPDGGFGLWRRGLESWPYASLHVAHALVRARQKGYPVDERLFERTFNHVRRIEQYIPSHYSAWSRRHIVAYALYVRGLNDDFDRSRARALIAEVDGLDELSFEALGWLLGVLTGDQGSAEELTAVRRFLANRVTETAASATFATGWHDGAHLIMHSSRRADGIILEALIDDQPDSDLITKIVHGLQAHRTRGRWGNTQENAFVLLALDKYFGVYEQVEPDFVARTWLGEGFAGEHHFLGRTTERHHIDIPMQWLARSDGPQDLVLDKDGAGRMYYRIGLKYAPRSLQLDAASHGFEVERVYHPVDDDDDVKQRDDGTWEIRAGARVKVELTMIAPARRYHVALVDPLPAGLESINPALAVSDIPVDDDPVRPMPIHRFWWWGPWYEHQNLRDERSEAFASLLPGGVHTFSYYARATTPGEFVVPPARAEEMYHPETFGRSATARVVIRAD
jgi:alpha-2-macroglobulin